MSGLMLGWMILRFSDMPLRIFLKAQMPVEFHASGAEGISEGSPVLYLGVSVGRVTGIRRGVDDLSVIIDAAVDQDPPLPGNVEAVIRTQILGGGSSISLVLRPAEGANGTDSATRPTTGRKGLVPMGRLQAGQIVRARFIGYDILPPEVLALVDDLTQTSEELRRIGQRFRESDLIGKLVVTVDTLNEDIGKAGKVLDKVDALVGDEAMRKNVHDAVANFRDVSEMARRIGQNIEKLSTDANARMNQLADRGDKVLGTAQGRIEDLSKQLSERLGQADKIFRELESAAKKLNEGKGSAGMLLNDPALFEGLLEVSRELKLTIQDIRRVVEGWEAEGVPLKLK